MNVFVFCHVSLVQRDEGIKIVAEAICSGIFNDLGSGSNVDVCVITKVTCLPPVSIIVNKVFVSR